MAIFHCYVSSPEVFFFAPRIWPPRDPKSLSHRPNVWSSAAPHPSPESIFGEETDGKDLPIISHNFAYYWDNRPEKWIAIGLWFSSKFSCDPVWYGPVDLRTWRAKCRVQRFCASKLRRLAQDLATDVMVIVINAGNAGIFLTSTKPPYPIHPYTL